MNEQNLLTRSGKLRHAFDILDVDQSGLISKKHLKKALKDAVGAGKVPDYHAASQIIQQIDLDVVSSRWSYAIVPTRCFVDQLTNSSCFPPVACFNHVSLKG